MSGMLYSFDVFDTLITRKVATPPGIFAVMGEILRSETAWRDIDDYIRDNFYWLRLQSEKLARAHYQHRGVEDVTLAQVYEAMGTTGALGEEQQRRLARLERETECRYVQGIEENIALARSLLARGERVVLISDMYLDAATIRRMLEKASPIFRDVPLYVSSEHKKGKYTGNLYRKVLELEQADFADWVHRGDNAHSDLAVPKSLGIRAELFAPEPLLPIERERLAAQGADAEAQRLVGLARNIRREQRGSYSENLGASVGGPILFAYAAWILREAQKHDIRRLYFIARDGYIPKMIADRLIRAWELPIETRYIYGSRKVWRMPSYEGMPGSLRRRLAWSYPPRLATPEKIAGCLRVPVGDLLPFLPEAYREPTRHLRWEEIELCLWSLERQPDFRKMLVKAMRPYRELAIRYLSQEIDVSDECFAFVDLGGSGLTQGCLANLMEAFCPYPVRTFFFKLDRIDFTAPGSCFNFLPSRLEHSVLIEMICRAPHGQTEDYRENGGNVAPVLRRDEGGALKAYGYEEYIRGVLAFAERCAQENIRSVSLGFVLFYLQYLVSGRDTKLLSYFADMPNTVSGREKTPISFAPRLDKRMIRDLFLLHAEDPKNYYYPGSDVGLSKKRCSPAEKKKIAFYEQNRETIKRRFASLWKRPLTESRQRETISMETLLFPFLGRIVLYGAGKYGQRLYRQCQESGGRIVGWLDRDAENLRTQGIPVTGTIEAIDTTAFDTAYIALLDENLAEKVREDLMRRGVPSEKILHGPLWKWREHVAHYLDLD